MDVQKMLEILKRDYGIESKEELIERFESSKGIDIGIFTERRQTAFSTGVYCGSTKPQKPLSWAILSCSRQISMESRFFRQDRKGCSRHLTSG